MKDDVQKQGRRWLAQAEADRKGGQLLLDGGSYHLACFISQQDAERALKAFLYAQGEELVTGRSVEVLCRWATEFDEALTSVCQKIATLDVHYYPTRDPNLVPDTIPARVYTRPVVVETLRMADRTLTAVRAKFAREDRGPNRE
jgi:HEPN domain-containing protein